MDFSKAYFVKIYTDVSPTAVVFGFHGRSLMDAVCKSCDRAGVLRLAAELVKDLPTAVASAIGCPDVAFVEEHLPKLLKHKAVVVRKKHLVVPRYHEAQYSAVCKLASNRASILKTREIKAALAEGLISPPLGWGDQTSGGRPVKLASGTC